MARQKKSAVQYAPFYEYLWQFYAANKKEIWTHYKPLTRKFLRANDPGDDEKKKTCYPDFPRSNEKPQDSLGFCLKVFTTLVFLCYGWTLRYLGWWLVGKS